LTDLYKVYTSKKINPDELKNILNDGRFNSGFYMSKFENAVSSIIKNNRFLSCNTTNLAFLLTLRSLSIKPGDEIIMSPMACLASIIPFIQYGANIIWTDIDPSKGTLNPDEVRKKITKNTAAILHYHWAGYPGHIEEINKIAKEHGILVIEDATEAFGSVYKNKVIGNSGADATVFSFNTVRLPNTVEGAGISFKSNEIFSIAQQLRDWGINRSTFRNLNGEINITSDISICGFGAVMNELNAYIGWKNMEDLTTLLTQQKANASIWDDWLSTRKYQALRQSCIIKPNYWVYSMLVDNAQQVLEKLRANDIYASQVHTRLDRYSCLPNLNSQPTLLGVETFIKNQLSVPCGWWITPDALNYKLNNIN
jgi:dTDP-4-amino-4,6-dideoxygalactose transaminase